MSPIYLRDMIYRAVRQEVLNSSNPGVCLSGGMDSSTVMAFAQDLPAFTGYYEGEAYDERKWARIARGREHHEILIQSQDFVDHFDNMLAAVAPPYTGPGMLGQYVVAKYAAQHVDTLLTGEGGDELFGGYARIIIVAGEKPPLGYENYKLPKGYPTNLRVALEREMEALQNLLRVDSQIAGAFGLEVRTPLLNPEIVNWVIHQSPDARVGKRMLRQAMRGHVDNAILNRKDKRGFPVPFVEWAQREPVKSFIADRIGYVPDPTKPWDRKWWNDLCDTRKTDYADNYDRIARDHIKHWRQTGKNPWQDDADVRQYEDATLALANYFAPTGPVLDVGCAMGDLLLRMPDRERTGCDISEDYLEIARERGLQVDRAYAHELPYPSESFDLVICCDVLEHVLNVNASVSEMLRVLRPGGVLIVRVPNEEDLSPYLGGMYEFVHLRRFDEPTLRLLFTRIFRTVVLRCQPVLSEINIVVRK